MQLQKHSSIWTESPITISYPNCSPAMDRAKRFEYNSIYYRDDPCRPKKKVDEFMFPHDLLARFRKGIRQASKSKKRDNKARPPRKNRSAFDEEIEKSDGIQPRANQITNKLYQRPNSLAHQRDFFGNRCSLQEKQLSQLCRLPHCIQTRNNSQQKIYITTAQRMDLSRPINFNPGPGAYLLSSISDYKRGLNTSMHSEVGQLKRKAHERMLKSIEIEDNSHH